MGLLYPLSGFESQRGHQKHMDDEDILEMVAEGELEPDQIEDFRELSDELQELVADGSISIDEAFDF